MTCLTLGPFAIDPDGVLEPRAPELRPAIRFDWRGRPVEAALHDGALELAAIAGRVPSTAEPGADRASAFEAIRSLPGSLPEGWRVRLLPDHRIQLEAATPVRPAATATTLVAAMVRFALALDPYLDRLDSTCATASGNWNT